MSIVDRRVHESHGTVRRLDRPSMATFVKEHLNAHVPCVISGLADDWPARKLWNAEYLDRKIGDIEVPMFSTKGQKSVFTDDVKKYSRMKFGDFLKLDHSPGAEMKHLMMQRSMEKVFPTLMPDIKLPPLFDPKHLFQINFWYLPADNLTLLHCDFAANLLTMVKGRKRLVLYPPGAPVYPHPVLGNFATVDIESPDPVKHRGFRRDGALETVLEEGEMLHIPGLWWHQVYSEPSISVNMWWWPRGFALARTLISRQFIGTGLKRVRQKLTARLFGKPQPTSIYAD